MASRVGDAPAAVNGKDHHADRIEQNEISGNETVWTCREMGCPRILRGVHRDSVRAGKSYESAGARRLSRFGGSGFSLASRMLRLSFERDRVAVVFARSAAVLGHCPRRERGAGSVEFFYLESAQPGEAS